MVNSNNMINMCSPYGDKLSFLFEADIVLMYINDAYVCSKVFSGNMDTDINLLILQRYDE